MRKFKVNKPKVCVCGHTYEEHDTPSGSCVYNLEDESCLCAGFESSEDEAPMTPPTR